LITPGIDIGTTDDGLMQPALPNDENLVPVPLQVGGRRHPDDTGADHGNLH
jgi:hypothetical protein